MLKLKESILLGKDAYHKTSYRTGINTICQFLWDKNGHSLTFLCNNSKLGYN